MVALGLNYFELLDMQALQEKEDISNNEAEEVISYCIEVILHIESKLGDIQKWWF